MSLLSPFSSFSPREGVGSKALTHQQVPFSPFISSLSSQLPLFLFSSLPFSALSPASSLQPYFTLCHCLSVFLSSLPLAFSYHFAFWICNLCPLFPCNPLSSVSLQYSLSLSPFLPLSLYLNTLHIPIVPSRFSSYTLSPHHCCLFTLLFPVSSTFF